MDIQLKDGRQLTLEEGQTALDAARQTGQGLYKAALCARVNGQAGDLNTALHQGDQLEILTFEDDDGKMNRALHDVGGGMLIVSQFTLYGDCRKGRRPSFIEAAPAEEGNRLYEYFVGQVKNRGVEVAYGVFQAHMAVEIVNDGPVTLILDTRQGVNQS